MVVAQRCMSLGTWKLEQSLDPIPGSLIWDEAVSSNVLTLHIALCKSDFHGGYNMQNFFHTGEGIIYKQIILYKKFVIVKN